METKPKIPLKLEPHLMDFTILLLLSILYTPLLIHWYDGWLNKTISIEHEYFSHGLIGLPYAAYIAWINRSQWSELPPKFHFFGAILLGISGAFYLTHLSDLINLSFPLMLTGLCLGLKGGPGFKLYGIPLLLVWLATPNPIPYLIEPLAFPLQHFIAAISGLILNHFGLNVTVNQIYLYVGNKIVEIAPHCAGLKMLFTSFYVSLILLHWTGLLHSRLRSVLFLVSAVIISIAANILRNTLLTLFYGIHQLQLFSWLHEGWGGDAYSAAMLGFLMLLISGIERYFPYEPKK